MKVLVVYYSRYGHVLQLAQSVMDGVKSVAGVEAVLRRVKEFEDIERDLAQHQHALAVWNRQRDIPVCTLNDLKEADGIIFGTPTRYGNMTAQMKRLFDATAPTMAGRGPWRASRPGCSPPRPPPTEARRPPA